MHAVALVVDGVGVAGDLTAVQDVAVAFRPADDKDSHFFLNNILKRK